MSNKKTKAKAKRVVKHAQRRRTIDQSGRVVIPKEFISDILKFPEHEANRDVTINVTDDAVVIKRLNATCFFCDNTEHLTDYAGIKLCRQCIENIKEL